MSFSYCHCDKPVRHQDLPGWCKTCGGSIDELMQKVASSMQDVGDLDLKPMSRRTSPAEMLGSTTVDHRYRRHRNKTGRNEGCPCYSGKKYKHCCGRN